MVDKFLMTEEEYLAKMKESQEYLDASDTEKLYMEEQWRMQYEDYVNARKTGADWWHVDEFDYGTAGKKGNGKGSGNGNKDDPTITEIKGWHVEYNGKSYGDFLTEAEADMAAQRAMYELLHQYENIYRDLVPAEDLSRVVADAIERIGYPKIEPIYKKGGLVDFTGPAWVDGTPLNPEAFLSAEDTKLMRGFLNAFSRVAVPAMSNIDSSMFGGGGTTIGDVHITITEAQFKEDADYEKVAQRVGEAFVKELNQQGLLTNNYSF